MSYPQISQTLKAKQANQAKQAKAHFEKALFYKQQLDAMNKSAPNQKLPIDIINSLIFHLKLAQDRGHQTAAIELHELFTKGLYGVEPPKRLWFETPLANNALQGQQFKKTDYDLDNQLLSQPKGFKLTATKRLHAPEHDHTHLQPSDKFKLANAHFKQAMIYKQQLDAMNKSAPNLQLPLEIVKHLLVHLKVAQKHGNAQAGVVLNNIFGRGLYGVAKNSNWFQCQAQKKPFEGQEFKIDDIPLQFQTSDNGLEIRPMSRSMVRLYNNKKTPSVLVYSNSPSVLVHRNDAPKQPKSFKDYKVLVTATKPVHAPEDDYHLEPSKPALYN